MIFFNSELIELATLQEPVLVGSNETVYTLKSEDDKYFEYEIDFLHRDGKTIVLNERRKRKV